MPNVFQVPRQQREVTRFFNLAIRNSEAPYQLLCAATAKAFGYIGGH
jgi:hypothetical protein